MSDAAGPPAPLRRDWTPSIPGYEVEQEIGRGGFALVYRAQQLALYRTVAVKVVSGLDVDATRLRRFERECAAIGSLSSHPHVVSVYDAGTTNEGLPFLAMEYLPEGSLADRLKIKGKLHVDDVVEIGIQLCGALEAAHQSDVLHRDIKPENILVGAQGQVKLADFGIAFVADTTSHTATGTMVGTVKHSAPEVLGGARATVSADVYSLGSTMFALLAGTAPFWRASDESAVPAMLRATRDPLPDLREHGVPDAVAEVIERACAKKTADRFPSAAAFGEALQAIQPKLGDSVTPMQTGEIPIITVGAAAPPAPPDAKATPATPPPAPADPAVTSVSATTAENGEATAVTPEDDATAVTPTTTGPPGPAASSTHAASAPAARPEQREGSGMAAGPAPTAAPGPADTDRPGGRPPRVAPFPAADAGGPDERSQGVPRWAIPAAIAAVVLLVVLATVLWPRGDDNKLATGDDGKQTDESSTTASSEPSPTDPTAPDTSASTTEPPVTESTPSTTEAPPQTEPPPTAPPGGAELENAIAVTESDGRFSGFTVSDTSRWTTSGVSPLVTTDAQGREKISVFIDGRHVGFDYTLPSYNLTVTAHDAEGMTVAYDLFNANEDDNTGGAVVEQYVVRFNRVGDRLNPDKRSASANRADQPHR